MNFADAIQVCFQKYVDFSGRAKRPEYWWFFLFCILGSLGLEMVSSMLSWIFSLATLLPSLAVGARRLHDTSRSGWLQLLWIVPIIGWIIMIVFLVQEGQSEDNRYGATPAN